MNKEQQMIDEGMKEVSKWPAAERFEFYMQVARSGTNVYIKLFRDELGQMREFVQFERGEMDTTGGKIQ